MWSRSSRRARAGLTVNVPPQGDPSAPDVAAPVHGSPWLMKALPLATPPAWNLPTAWEAGVPGGMRDRSAVKSSAVRPVRVPVRFMLNVHGLIASDAAGIVYVSAFGLAIVPAMLPVSEIATLKAPKPSAPFGFGAVARSASKTSA